MSYLLLLTAVNPSTRSMKSFPTYPALCGSSATMPRTLASSHSASAAMGYSSGGFLSLYAATAPVAENFQAEDLVDRESSRLQAVVAYYSGTDLLNYGGEYMSALQRFPSSNWTFAWDDNTMRFERISDPERLRQMCRECSPITHVSAATAPVLIFHGDQDKLVPLQRSERFVARLRDAGVTHKLVTVEGKSHGWPTPVEGEMEGLLGWFGQHLLGDRQ